MRFLKTLFGNRHAVTEDGAVQKRNVKNAPKTITSELIINFKCVFSTETIMDDIPIEHGVYALSARLSDGAVRGEYKMHTHSGGGEQFLFHNSHRFMRELQSIVGKYNFAEFNGKECHVSGLPDMYGAEIRIVYASGERIDSSDNQDCFLPIEAMEALAKLFLKQNNSIKKNEV